uniref:Sialic acid binding Ig like lectin 1 n=1 Tax=Falco tinnunculus TaxID=100819 RepID=A0A8C4V948_FALTI
MGLGSRMGWAWGGGEQPGHEKKDKELGSLGSWGVTYPTSLQGIRGSCVVIPCTLSYPDDMAADDGIVAIWYKDYDNQKTLVYHSAAQEVDAGFRDRAQLLGDPAARNCTLLLRRLTLEDHGPYRFRFEIINGDRWSAERDVMLSVLGGYSGETPPLCQLPACLSSHRHPTLCSLPLCSPDTALHHLTLTTSFSWKDHSKKLLCEVSYGSKKATSEVVLRVRRTWGGSAQGLAEHSTGMAAPLPRPHHPGISSKPREQSQLLAIVSCTVDSHPPATIALYRDGTLLAASVTTSRNALRLEIRGTGPQDSGEYRCMASNAYGSTSATKFFVARGESQCEGTVKLPLGSISSWPRCLQSSRSPASGRGDPACPGSSHPALKGPVCLCWWQSAGGSARLETSQLMSSVPKRTSPTKDAATDAMGSYEGRGSSSPALEGS